MNEAARRSKRVRLLAGACVALAALLPWAARALTEKRAEPDAPIAMASADPALPNGIDTLVSLESLGDRLAACDGRERCAGIVYVWSPEMPLSRLGIGEVAAAARALGLDLAVVPSRELHPGQAVSAELRGVADALLAAGATLHAPALVVHEGGVLDRSAILGYKTADAYESLVSARLRSGLDVSQPTASRAAAGLPVATSAAAPRITFKDFAVPGTPGPYFRWVPGRDALAYEAGGQIYLLDLKSGERMSAPGYVDFVPTPDGRFFVTPGRNRELEFYDAEQVFSEARAGRGRAVRPFYSDEEMKDQYPSVGILSTSTRAGDTRTVYRVLTSWFDAVVFRDYEVVTSAGRSSVRPLGAPVEACRSNGFSIPIMAPTGREVAGRDESTATTKVFRLADDGGCQEVVDLSAPTGKVAWDPDARRVAFAIPEGAVRDGSGVVWLGRTNAERAGIYVFDLKGSSAARVEASMDARRLTFPEWVGKDQVVFLLPPEGRGESGRFRLVCCLP
jgi:hypothetical protein